MIVLKAKLIRIDRVVEYPRLPEFPYRVNKPFSSFIPRVINWSVFHYFGKRKVVNGCRVEPELGNLRVLSLKGIHFF